MSLRTTHYAHPAALGFVRLSAFRGSLLSAALCRARARRVSFRGSARQSIFDHRSSRWNICASWKQFSCRDMCIAAWMMNWRRIHSNFIYRMSNDVFWHHREARCSPVQYGTSLHMWHLCSVQYRTSLFIVAAAESQFGVSWHKWTHTKTWIPYQISRIHL